ncbi:MAG: putative type II restriction enzyme [Candidatus Thorarchaeota archaeon]|nr:MAG: putative type II restriction enzyme [Candidatus Thorarchaeota archaeon]
MKNLVGKIVGLVLSGEDYRPEVLATISMRFLTKIQEMVSEVFLIKESGKTIRDLLFQTYKKKGKENKFKLLWYSGLNNKTVRNMEGTTKKEVCLKLGLENIQAFIGIFTQDCSEMEYKISLRLKRDDTTIELNEIESTWFLNAIASMKMSIQGGAWSEVGKLVESSLLYSIFNILEIPETNYIIDIEDIKKRCDIKTREIDGVLIDKEDKCLTIEVKLLGIGNPEIGDEAIAREVDLFLTDRMTEMMISEGEKKGIKTVEFRQEDAIDKIFEFLSSSNIPCSKPSSESKEERKLRIEKLVSKYLE